MSCQSSSTRMNGHRHTKSHAVLNDMSTDVSLIIITCEAIQLRVTFPSCHLKPAKHWTPTPKGPETAASKAQPKTPTKTPGSYARVEPSLRGRELPQTTPPKFGARLVTP